MHFFLSTPPPPNSQRVNLSIVLKRLEEGVDPFGAGDLEVDVDIHTGRDLGNILAVVLVVRDSRPPVAVDGEAGDQQIIPAQDGALRIVLAGGVLLATRLDQRPRRLDLGLRAVDVDILLGIVVLVVLRTGPEKVFLAFLVAGCVSPEVLRSVSAVFCSWY